MPQNSLYDFFGSAPSNALARAGGQPNVDVRRVTPQAASNALGGASMFMPSPLGDVAGLAADAMWYAGDPMSLTPTNGLLSLAALVPGIPRTPKKLYRGVGAGGKSLGVGQLGKGLYSSTSKDFARQYATDPKTKKMTGSLMELDPAQAFPSNPLVLPGYGRGGANGIFSEWLLEQSGEKNIRDFAAKWPDPGEFVKSKGYDGVWIGEEIVKY